MRLKILTRIFRVISNAASYSAKLCPINMEREPGATGTEPLAVANLDEITRSLPRQVPYRGRLIDF